MVLLLCECVSINVIHYCALCSLFRLQTDYIDLYQIHWPDRYVPMFGETEYDPTRQFESVGIEEQLDALGRAIDAGKIRYVGLSNETPYGFMKFLQVVESTCQFPRIVTVQNSYNLLCRNFESGLAECCHHERISLLAYSPLAMGILSGKYLSHDKGPTDARFLFDICFCAVNDMYHLSRHIDLYYQSQESTHRYIICYDHFSCWIQNCLSID
ncbi:putative voltage-gated potassium channel subunit beta [Heracleum sosnowskyi]|uniref:Voltage-gated potassium channel subunit beta n=1 Tax=Heracleum sosnowskyi TaxID=360622 RepID=A0AAD8MWB9_9APIA|nr:putative voltage-gated potassium channel subunit beta [Heracleum sosnowskyi]